MRPIVTNSLEKTQLQNYVSRVFDCLCENKKLANDKKLQKLWKKSWGRPAYPNRVNQHKLNLQTNRRRAFLLRIFRIASDIIQTKHLDVEDARILRSHLSRYRRQTGSYRNCVMLAIDAAFAHLILRSNPTNKKFKIALCYSAFGKVSKGACRYAKELCGLFADIFKELNIYATIGINDDIPAIPCGSSVNVHIRKNSLAELVAFPGIKAPGLIAACAKAVRDNVDLIVTMDGDGRLPLFQIIPAITEILESEEIDAVLGSRRVRGAIVSKPGIRHLSSMLFASYVGAVMEPVLGEVRDPQAIFKVFRRKQLSCALKRLGFSRTTLLLNNLQSGSLACELLLLSNLTENGRKPRLLEVPVIETMAYPANPMQMPIMTSSNIKAMTTTVNKPRVDVREYPLIGEGTESLVIYRNNGEVWKIPRGFERLSQLSVLPVSIVTDNRLLQFSMSLSGTLRTIVNELASRSHPDRGFGFNATLVELMVNSHPDVREYLPSNMRIELIENAIRLPFLTAILMKCFWKIDRLVCNIGSVIMRIGMLPMMEIRAIGLTFRIFWLILRWLRFFTRPVIRVLRKTFSLYLSFWDLTKNVLKKILRRAIYLLEITKVIRIFACIDKLDQKNRFFHRYIQVTIRLLLEARWLFESFNISVGLGRPVLCLVQPHTIRSFWKVLESLPNTMTDEIQSLLKQALQVYQTLGENGYYDGEVSLDNLGFEVDGLKIRVVLIDYGAVVNIKNIRSDLLRGWLVNVREDYEKSYQVHKLRCYAKGNPEVQKIAEDYIKNSLELLAEWIKRT